MQNMLIWIIAGGIVGWASFAYLKFNFARGLALSIILGAVGGLFGGNVLGPLFSAAPQPDQFNYGALFMAVTSAAGCLIGGNMIYNRFGV
jgi:uncharacterized membrane protein YeaQ/YmgE (transglycosylase-associated protein family)